MVPPWGSVGQAPGRIASGRRLRDCTQSLIKFQRTVNMRENRCKPRRFLASRPAAHGPAAAAHDGAARRGLHGCTATTSPPIPTRWSRAMAPTLTAIATRGDYPLRGDGDAAVAATLQLIASSGTGYDAIDIEAARALGIAVTNTPGGERRVRGRHRVGADPRHRSPHACSRTDTCAPAAGSKAPVPLTDKVRGEALGIVGLGDIGKAIARASGRLPRWRIAYHGRQPPARRAVSRTTTIRSSSRAT